MKKGTLSKKKINQAADINNFPQLQITPSKSPQNNKNPEIQTPDNEILILKKHTLWLLGEIDISRNSTDSSNSHSNT